LFIKDTLDSVGAMMIIFLCCLGALGLGSFLFVWLFNFIKYMPFSVLKERLSSAQGRGHMFRTSCSFGFGKSSVRVFRKYLYLLRNPPPIARMGYVAPDCTLVDLNGENKSLHKDFLNTDIPIVITMGSYS
jgi:hypothetical protein